MKNRTFLYTFAKIVIQPFLRPFLPCKIQNRENCPKEGAVIICCNHLGMSDPFRLAFALRRQIFYMSKSELFQKDHWPLGMLLRWAGAFPVQRGRHDSSAIDRGAQLLKDGNVMGIFIEGTRSRDGSFGQPKAGAVMLAHGNNIPILPVCITPVNGSLPKLFKRAYVTFGELIQPEALGITKEGGSELRAASRMVMGKIEALRARDLGLLEAGISEN